MNTSQLPHSENQFVSKTIWPLVYGTLGIVLASLGIVSVLCFSPFVIIDAVYEDSWLSGPIYIIYCFITTVIELVLCAWLLASSIGLIKRKFSSYRSLCVWAILVIIYFLVSAPLEVLEVFVDPEITEQGSFMLLMLVALSVIFMLLLSFPITLLSWLKRQKIKKEIQNWL